MERLKLKAARVWSALVWLASPEKLDPAPDRTGAGAKASAKGLRWLLAPEPLPRDETEGASADGRGFWGHLLSREELGSEVETDAPETGSHQQ